MSPRSIDTYRARFERVLDYIDAHLAEDLDLARLGDLAACSKYHFLRQFSELFGVGVYKYVQLNRLKRASQQLAFRLDLPVIEIALDSGYDSPESFARAFKKNLGQTPTEFRKQPQWTPWHAIYQPLAQLRNASMPTPAHPRHVQLIDFQETPVAVLEHRGDPNLIGDSIRNFIAWRKQNHLPPARHATYNILYDDPYEVEPQDYRFDLCVATTQDIAENPFGIVKKTIPAGRCAVLRHVGSDDTLPQSVTYLYAEWLPQSGEEPRDFPLYLQRVRFFPDVPENEAIVDIFLPIE
ncbi:AraC family transcriptional regulator [Dyella mobilis]|uniref:AraC family transcriptional regulator n=1 Tax=Dyella mobilis TaxID=1849582 RepID=A0ABS2KJ67_9GAMM|nr:AraC family transcriptional regulator [Dyella mobilis]MBM7131075.1 AraC family transcriptional regulator [Dyella mobilis]GLQ97702.1 AraC family transcriptional regulator [Dyella mobilis]